MADIAFVAALASRADDFADNSNDFSFSFASGTSDCVVVGIYNLGRDADLVSGVTFNSIAGIRVEYSAQSDASFGVYAYIVPNSGGGTHNVVISKSGNAQLAMFAASYSDTNTAATNLAGIVNVFGKAFLNVSTLPGSVAKSLTSTVDKCYFVCVGGNTSGGSTNVDTTANAASVIRSNGGSVDNLIIADINAVTSPAAAVNQGVIATGGNFPAFEMVVFAILPPSTGSAGSADGSSTASGVGASTAASVGSAAGSATASGVSVATGNAVGSAAGSSTAGAVADTPSAITVDHFDAELTTTLLFVQRTGSSTNVLLSGTITGTLASALEASWQGGGQVQLTNLSVVGSDWTATLPSQAVGQGTLTVRVTNATSVNDSIELDIGIVVVIVGDSTAQSPGTSEDLGITTGIHAWVINPGATTFTNLLATSGGYQWTRFGQQLRAYFGCPILVLNQSQSGTRLDDTWLPPSGSDYVAIGTRLGELSLSGYEIGIGQIGSNSINPTNTPSSADYHDDCDLFVATAFLDYAAPYFLHLMVPDKGTGPWMGDLAAYRVDSDQLRQGILDYWYEGSAHIGANPTGDVYTDHTHPDNLSNSRSLAFKWFLATAYAYGSGGGIGPRFSAATIDGTGTVVSIFVDSDLSNAISSSVGGFDVLDDGVSVAANIIDVEVIGVRQLDITLDTPIVGDCTVSFASSEDAVGQTLPESVAFALADTSLQPTETIPLIPFFNEAMSDNIGVGNAAGSSTASAIGSSVFNSVGTAAGSSTAAAIGRMTVDFDLDTGIYTLRGFPATLTSPQTPDSQAQLSVIPQLRLRRSVLPS